MTWDDKHVPQNLLPDDATSQFVYSIKSLYEVPYAVNATREPKPDIFGPKSLLTWIVIMSIGMSVVLIICVLIWCLRRRGRPEVPMSSILDNESLTPPIEPTVILQQHQSIPPLQGQTPYHIVQASQVQQNPAHAIIARVTSPPVQTNGSTKPTLQTMPSTGSHQVVYLMPCRSHIPNDRSVKPKTSASPKRDKSPGQRASTRDTSISSGNQVKRRQQSQVPKPVISTKPKKTNANQTKEENPSLNITPDMFNVKNIDPNATNKEILLYKAPSFNEF